ncbi:hypothetical protein BB559_000551 [Furculomyces boomerangus]|uniref:Uncharacterized protein n=1 Tax=Furculomyces boomerangus TaxID=61424 RepID=A0A2T9Z506_9FUNG|nr:hypothetical protein BB559_000551 [Furculomyces boomerangus]
MSNFKTVAQNALKAIRELIPDPSKTRPLARFAVENAKSSASLKNTIKSESSVLNNDQSPLQIDPTKHVPVNILIQQKNNSESKIQFQAQNQQSINAAVLNSSLSEPRFNSDIQSIDGALQVPNLTTNQKEQVMKWLRDPIVASTISINDVDSKNYDGIKSYEFAIKEAISLVNSDLEKIDPLSLVGAELSSLTDNISRMLESGNPALSKVAQYYFQSSGKQIRPLVVLLMSQTVNGLVQSEAYKSALLRDYTIIDKSVPQDLVGDSESVIRDNLIRKALSESLNKSLYTPTFSNQGQVILPTQRRLAEITELIHTASLVHDDIIDNSPSRRGLPSTHQVFGNKIAVLAGDFLLARASVSLARLRNPEVVELLATVIMDLVEGEFKQLKNVNGNNQETPKDTQANYPNEDIFSYYLQKTYLKTSSLFAKSIRAASILGGAPTEYVELSYIFGRNLGTAFQLVDDLLDFTATQTQTGKPVGADLDLGIATAPVLYAWQEYPELGELIKRRFSEQGDAQLTWKLVHQSSGIQKTRKLVMEYAERAMAALSLFPPNASRQALLQLAHSLVYRKM